MNTHSEYLRGIRGGLSRLDLHPRLIEEFAIFVHAQECRIVTTTGLQ